jgi:hypothetical protein
MLKHGCREMTVIVPSEGDEDVNAKLAEAEEFLEALESGKLHIGAPFEGRTEAKMHDLRRQIATYRQTLSRRKAAQ